MLNLSSISYRYLRCSPVDVAEWSCTGYVASIADMHFAKSMQTLENALGRILSSTHYCLCQHVFEPTKYEVIKTEARELLPVVSTLIWEGRSSSARCGDGAEKVYGFFENDRSLLKALLGLFGARCSTSMTKGEFLAKCNVFPICDTCGYLGHTFRRTYSDPMPEWVLRRRRERQAVDDAIEEEAIEVSI